MNAMNATRSKIVNGFRLTPQEFRELLECKHAMSVEEGKVLSIREVVRRLLRGWASQNADVLDRISRTDVQHDN